MRCACARSRAPGLSILRVRKGETTVRPGLVVNTSASGGRTALFSVAARSRELRAGSFRDALATMTQWAAAGSSPTTPEPGESVSGQKRIYILRSGDDASDKAALQALEERGHAASLGVRASQLASAAVRLSDYHAVVMMGALGERISQAGANLLAAYMERSGALIVDGYSLYQMDSATALRLNLPAAHCGWRLHPSGMTAFERVDPGNATVQNGIPSTFAFSLTTLNGTNEHCLRQSAGGRILYYSRTEGEVDPRVGVLTNEPGPGSRAVNFSASLQNRELSNGDFRRLFVNAVEWASAKSEPTQLELLPDTSKRLKIYILRSGDAASDNTLRDALRASHDVSLGVSTSQLGSVVDPR